MTPSDTEIVGLMAKLYAPQPGDFDHVEDPGGDDGVCWAVKHYDGLDALIFRGSMTKEDWFRDLLAEMADPGSLIPERATVGPLPLGFDIGLQDAFVKWSGLHLSRTVVAGHSLGAARAAITAGLIAASGAKVERLVMCGCPRPGTSALKKVLIDSYVPIASYRNLSDPVCDVPTDPPWLHVADFIPLSEAPAAGDISIFRDHHIPLYMAGVAAYESAHA